MEKCIANHAHLRSTSAGTVLASAKLNAMSHAAMSFSTQAVAADSAHLSQLSNSHSPTFPSYSQGDIAWWISVPTCSCSIKWTIFHYLHFLVSSNLLPIVVCSFRKPLWSPSLRSCLAGKDFGWLWVGYLWAYGEKGRFSTAIFCDLKHPVLWQPVWISMAYHQLEVIAREKGKRSVAPINRVVRKSRSYSRLLKKRYSLLKGLNHPIVACPTCGAVLRSRVPFWWGTRIKRSSAMLSSVRTVCLNPSWGLITAQGLCVCRDNEE